MFCKLMVKVGLRPDSANSGFESGYFGRLTRFSESLAPMTAWFLISFVLPAGFMVSASVSCTLRPDRSSRLTGVPAVVDFFLIDGKLPLLARRGESFNVTCDSSLH